MKMLFVDPETKANTNVPNIGLAYISSGLKEDHIIVDQTTRPFPKDRFLAIKADWFGVSTKLNTYHEAVRISKLYKEKYPEAKIVWGGPQISCAFERIKAENPGVELFAGEWDSKKDLDSLPFPDFSKFDSFQALVKGWSTGRRHYPIVTSRGCPYGCTYCASHIISGRVWRARSAKNCFDELKLAKEKFNIRSFEILDDSFNVDKERVIEFCSLIKPLKLTWFCSNGIRADRLDEDAAKAMSDAGCKFVSFGIESADPEVLKAIKKGETIDQIESAVDVAEKYFKSVNGYFIIGLPKSSYEKDLASLKWALDRGIMACFSFLVPFEGTEIREGSYKDETYEDALFSGEGAHPISGAYPKELQMRIFKMTEYMRGITKKNVLRKILISFGGIIKYEPTTLPAHIFSGVDKLKRKFL